MDSGTLKRLTEDTAESLGIIRAAVCAVFFFSLMLTSFGNLGRLPITVMRPIGVMRYFSWDFYDLLLTPHAMNIFKFIVMFFLLAAMIGIYTQISVAVSAILVIFYQGLVRSFGHFNHDEMIAVYFLCILAFTPCGRAFSIDAWRKNRNHQSVLLPSFIYGYPILLMQILLSWVYFSSALVKLRAGRAFFSNADNLPVLSIIHSLDNLHDTEFRLAFYLPEYKYYVLPLVILTVIWELAFPLAVVWRRARPVILIFGIIFHILTLFVMNITFPYQTLMYLVFIDWKKLAAMIKRKIQDRKTQS